MTERGNLAQPDNAPDAARANEKRAAWESASALRQRPMIWADELDRLAARYGAPIRRTYQVQADDYIYSYRWREDSDRRAEVVFAIQDKNGRVWVHAKAHYPARVFRLPSGGIHWDEPVEDALFREIDEEMGLPVRVVRFLGLVEYRFLYGDSVAPFASYVFHLQSGGGRPISHEDEMISEFRAVLPGQMRHIALKLRRLNGDRRGWGQWRALVHDLVYECLGGAAGSSPC